MDPFPSSLLDCQILPGVILHAVYYIRRYLRVTLRDINFLHIRFFLIRFTNLQDGTENFATFAIQLFK